MGGKGGGGSTAAAVTPTMPSVDTSGMTNMLSQMQASNTAAILQAQQQMNEAISKIDDKDTQVEEQTWSDKMAALKAKVAADTTEIAAKKRGRASTILTSPLNDEEVKTTGSILMGK